MPPIKTTMQDRVDSTLRQEVKMFSAKSIACLLLLTFTTTSSVSQAMTQKDVVEVQSRLSNVRSFIRGFRTDAVFKLAENKLGSSTSIFEVKDTRDMFDNLLGAFEGAGKITAGISGIVTAICTVANFFVVDAGAKQLLTAISNYGVASTAAFGGLSLGLDYLNADRRVQIAQITSSIAVARQAYDDFLARRSAYTSQLALLDSIEKMVNELIGLNTNLITPDAIAKLTQTSNDLLRFSAMIDDSLVLLQSHVEHYKGLTESIGKYVKGDVKALVANYEQISKDIDTGLGYYKTTVKPELESLSQIISRMALLPR